MSSMALDTHAYYKKLVATGLRDDQAEAIASGLVNGLTDNLATKDELHSEIALVRSDMGAMEDRLRGEMAAMEERLEGKIDSVEERLNGKISLVRADMGAMEERLRGEIAVVRTDMADMQVKLMRYMTTLVLGSGGVIIAAMKLLP
jgi:hypothetical protein